MKKNILYIGNRANALHPIFKDENLHIVKVFALEESYLAKEAESLNIDIELFSLQDKQTVFEKINEFSFDILISNGCPFILPVSKLKKEHQLFINVHPTYLPYLKGKTGINGVFYNNMDFFGATVHYIDEGVDTGNIICQEKQALTTDIDLGLLYFLSFEMEKKAMTGAITKLKENDWNYIGMPQNGKGTIFNREDSMSIIDFTSMNIQDVLRVIKSFGIKSQGSFARISGREIILFEAEKIENKYLIDTFSSKETGSIVLEYDAKLIVKLKDGIIKITRYEWR